MATTHWKPQRDDDNICWLHLDVADSSTNVLSFPVIEELNQVLDQELQSPPRGLVFLSDKANGFIAGADIKEFTALKDRQDALDMLNRGHALMDKIEALPFPTVAMIKGFCLGGGMELALACDYRIMCDDRGTRVGLPEIKLGIHPGYGGTVRSIQRAGPAAAMGAMLTGRMLQGRQAKRMGLVTDLVPERQLMSASRYCIHNRPAARPLPLKDRIMNHRLVRPVVARQMRKQVAAKAPRTHYPAPYKLIDLWTRYMDNPRKMLQREAESVAELAIHPTARNLVRVFFLQEQLKSLGKKNTFKPAHVHVIGGGIMGGDIAAWCALRGFRVTVQDQQPEALAGTMKRAMGMYRKKFKKDKAAIREAMDRLIPDHRGMGVSHADIIIEAIFEDLEVKQALYRDIEPRMKANTILASNTSSIPLEQLATCLEKPGRLVGVHFFNPVALMPLVEIVRGDNTDDKVMQQAQAFGRQIDKLPLPVKSSPGFLVNRILMPYLLEAVEMIGEGIPAEMIDKAALHYGMPMGPVELADTVGLDVCLSVANILSRSMDVNLPRKLESLVSQKKLGKKTGQGFYEWKKGKPMKNKNASYGDMAEVENRLVLRLLNEAAACLREKVVEEADLVDAGVIFGTGFAPFRGGPLHYIQEQGKESLMSQMERSQKNYGDRFKADAGWEML